MAAVWLAHSIAVAIALLVITYLHLVLGEYSPKALGIEKAETLALATAPLMQLFYRTFKPFIWLINVSGIKFLKLFGVNFRPGHHAAYTEEEIRYLVNASHESGHLQQEEKELIHNVFDFAELSAREVLVPRTEVTVLEDTVSFDEVVHQFQSTGQRATERTADPDMDFPGRMLAEHWIKRDHLKNVDRLETEFFRDPEDGFIADEPKVFLPQMQQRHRRTTTVLARITRNRRVHFLL